MIELRPDTSEGAKNGDLDEVVAHDASVHLEVLSDNAVMLTIEDGYQHVHLRITHRGKSPLRIWKYESFAIEPGVQVIDLGLFQ